MTCQSPQNPSVPYHVPARLQEAIRRYDAEEISKDELEQLQDDACRDSIERMEATGSPIASDGEQRASASRRTRSSTRWPAPAWPTTSRRTASTSPSSTTATTASCHD